MTRFAYKLIFELDYTEADNVNDYPCSTLVLGRCPETDSELSVKDGTTAKNLLKIKKAMQLANYTFQLELDSNSVATN